MNVSQMNNEIALAAGLVVQAPPPAWSIKHAIQLRGDSIQAPLTVVICRSTVRGTIRYSVWAHNRQDGGYHHGEYLSNFPEALEVFCDRLKRYGFHLVEELK